MKKITDYKIRIGDKLDFISEGGDRVPVTITDIIFDGFVFLIEFKQEDGREFGLTEHPNRLKQRILKNK
jgi:hypothetical protein